MRDALRGADTFGGVGLPVDHEGVEECPPWVSWRAAIRPGQVGIPMYVGRPSQCLLYHFPEGVPTFLENFFLKGWALGIWE